MAKASRTSFALWRQLLFACLALGWLAGCSGSTRQTTIKQTPVASTQSPPTATSTPTASQLQAATADRLLAGMTLDQKLGQLLMLQFTTVGYVDDSVTMMRQIQPGALILYKYELPDAATVKQMTAQAQHDAHIPLLISADEEGGAIDQFAQIYGATPSATYIGSKNDPQYAYQQGSKIAKNMQAVGFNLDLAPDVDVQTFDGPDQRSRTFGTTPDQVTKLAGAWLQGLQATGVAGTLKHFPGLGDAQTDAHLDLPVINETKDQIERIDLAPYRNLLAQGNVPGMIMSTDLLMPALDPNTPAELSPKIITGVLRNELHYDGVVLTDALYMHGISAQYTQTQAGVQALVAGCDMLLGPASTGTAAAMIAAIKQAINNGTLTQARIDQSVRRILLLKLRFGLIPLGSGTSATGQSVAQPLGDADVRKQA